MDAPTREQWLGLHQEFREFCQATPWQWFDDADLLAVEHPSGEYRGYCVVLGSGGIEYGLAVYKGDEGLAGYMALMSGAIDSDSPESLYSMNAVSAMLADREHLSQADRDTIRDLGLRYRGRGKWPLFTSVRPGYVPWRLDSDEAVLLTQALRSVRAAAVLVENGELTLQPGEAPRPVLAQDPHEGGWQYRWSLLRLPSPLPDPDYPDTERIMQLAKSKPRAASVWELGIFHLNSPVQESRGERPYFPVIALIVDPDSTLVIPQHSTGPNPSAADRQGMLVKLLEEAPELPSRIVVDTLGTAFMVESITAPLDIQLSVGDTPSIYAIQEGMDEFYDE